MNARCFLLALALLLPAGLAAAESGPAPYKPGEVLVRFKSGCSEADRAAVRAEMNGSLIRKFDIGVEHIRLLGEGVEATVQQFSNHALVEYVEPNYAIQAAAVPNDPLFPQLWNMRNTGQEGGMPLADIRIVPLWDDFTGDSTIKVGVLDSGINLAHPDIVANLWTNPGEIPGNGMDDDNNGYPDDVHGFNFTNEGGRPDLVDGYECLIARYECIPPNDNSAPMGAHGSHVAGIIGARGDNNTGVVGVAWKVELVAIKILTACSIGPPSGWWWSNVDRAIAGIEYSLKIGCKITNNSWYIPSGEFSQTLYDAIAVAADSGQLFVAAAANFGEDGDVEPQYPASYDLPNIVSVAATDRNDQLWYLSNYGAVSVDLAAPGAEILSLTWGSGYDEKSGTSMATPHVTGTAALIMGAYPDSSADFLKARILAGVDTLSSLRGKVLTSGRLNAYKAFHGLTDGIAPGAVQDLALEAGRTMVAVSWTNPGDDGSTGTAAAFDLRYATEPITSANFYSATAVATWEPGSPGSPHCEFVGPLSSCQTHYFAVKTRDEAYNWSPLSNVASGSTSCSGTWEPECGIERPEVLSKRVPGNETVDEGLPEAMELVFAPGGSDGRPRTIRYGVPAEKAGQALELAAFDLAGRRVRMLARGTSSSGRFAAEWDLRSDQGHTLPRGLYLVRLRVGDVMVTRKLLHAR